MRDIASGCNNFEPSAKDITQLVVLWAEFELEAKYDLNSQAKKKLAKIVQKVVKKRLVAGEGASDEDARSLALIASEKLLSLNAR
jgi:vesicle coat complex subunit